MIHLYGIRLAVYGNDGGSVKVFGKGCGIYCGRRYYQAQIRTHGKELFQKAEDEVDVKAPFVCFVHHYDAVGRQQGVIFEFFEKNSVRHDLDACIGIRGVVEPHLAGGIRIVFAGLLADELGDTKRGYAPRLGDSHYS